MPDPDKMQPASLRTRILDLISQQRHREVTFRDLNEVPNGSHGHLQPSAAAASRLEDGRWMVSGVITQIASLRRTGAAFVSHTGPANDARLAELIESSLVLRNHLLVDFEVGTEHEPADWEGSQPAYDYSFMTNPQILAHDLDDADRAGLYFEAEAGMLGESDVYSDLSKRIEDLGKDAAMVIRDKATVNRHEWLQLDTDDQGDL